ncbi:MAG: hypothetical protein MJ202_04295 [Lentisphaeria bacterium]|nr:hypothetical protein [Lentisphaeria bacterium]
MSFFARKSYWGLACDNTEATALSLSRRGASSWRVRSLHYISWKNEGLTDNSEIRKATMDWLQANRLPLQQEVACLLPQSQVNVAISDFPPVHEADKLSQMVAYQTRQLAGLSGVELIHDFQQIRPMANQVNPMLIAVAREDDLDTSSEFYQEAGIDIGEVVPAGLALHNAFCLLQPNAALEQGLQAILDCREEQTMVILNWQSRIQHICILPVSCHHPLDLVRQFENSLRAWKNLQMDESRNAVLEKVWLSGPGAVQDGLLEDMPRLLGIASVELLGVPVRSCPRDTVSVPARNGVYPSLSIAFGLAAQKLGIAPLAISLLPKRISWQKERLSQFFYLALAATLLLLFLGWLFYSSAKNIHQQAQDLKIEEKILDECLNTAPLLQKAYQEISDRQQMLIPIAEAGLRTRRFLQAMQTWQEAMPIPKQNGWSIYLADEFSFNENNAPNARNAGATLRRDASRIGGAASALTAASQGDDQQPAVMPRPTSVDAIPLLTRMYAGGILPATTVKYQTVKEFQSELNRSDTFVNVDDYTDFLSEDFIAGYFAPWQNFLSTYRQVLKKDYTFYLLQLPFLDNPVQLPPQE